MSETFLGLTAIQVDGISAIATLLLTLALVLITWWYAWHTHDMAKTSKAALQHEMDRARQDRDAKRGVVGANAAAIKGGIGAILELDLVRLRELGTMPQKLPNPPIESATLIACAMSVAPELVVHIGTALAHVERGEWHLGIMAGLTNQAGIQEQNRLARSCFQLALSEVQETIDLMKTKYRSTIPSPTESTSPAGGESR